MSMSTRDLSLLQHDPQRKGPQSQRIVCRSDSAATRISQIFEACGNSRESGLVNQLTACVERKSANTALMRNKRSLGGVGKKTHVQDGDAQWCVEQVTVLEKTNLEGDSKKSRLTGGVSGGGDSNNDRVCSAVLNLILNQEVDKGFAVRVGRQLSRGVSKEWQAGRVGAGAGAGRSGSARSGEGKPGAGVAVAAPRFAEGLALRPSCIGIRAGVGRISLQRAAVCGDGEGSLASNADGKGRTHRAGQGLSTLLQKCGDARGGSVLRSFR
mmetsp:Transcript_80333/g.215321  ORF Transcript_80333/g.215321 Transcript_80333/m.215321 type:complete len:269 (-) Transcript_80333:988-1794(-)